jgi:hypothetical protein
VEHKHHVEEGPDKDPCQVPSITDSKEDKSQIDPEAITTIPLTTQPDMSHTMYAAHLPSSSNRASAHVVGTPPDVGIRRARILTNIGRSTLNSWQCKDFGQERVTLVAIMQDRYVRLRDTLPTTTIALVYLPWDIIPFAFSMFTLVEALVRKGWMPVFAIAWDRWASHTGVVGNIAGMAFLGAVLSNVS